LSHEQIGQKTGKERTTVTNAVRLLQLPEDLQGLVASKQLSAGHARALLKFEDRELQKNIAQRCMTEGWSVRQIEHFTRPAQAAGKPKEKQTEPQIDPNVKFAMSELERILGTKVKIVETGKGKGRIEIEYYNPDDLNRVYEMIVKE
jgi:ParB family transcriptional regulator, chromosome partitioning protein